MNDNDNKTMTQDEMNIFYFKITLTHSFIKCCKNRTIVRNCICTLYLGRKPSVSQIGNVFSSFSFTHSFEHTKVISNGELLQYVIGPFEHTKVISNGKYIFIFQISKPQ